MQRILIVLSFVLVLGAPFLFRGESVEIPADARKLVVISPHMEEITIEFGEAFNAWHEREYGEAVVIDWRRPGGTSEIRKQLDSMYSAAIKSGQISEDGSCEIGTMPYDLFIGGGSYIHNVVKKGVSVVMKNGGEERVVRVPISTPIGYSQGELDGLFGINMIGSLPLYDPDRYWVGTALSSFGVLFNRESLASIGLPDPTGWHDLTDPRLAGWLALADPRQSGSVATTYESILTNFGWDEGWRILRALAANSRYFSSSSRKIVIDVSRGEAAAALAIDFYGRYESQAMLKEGQSADKSPVGYIDPERAVLVDPDPVSLLRGGPEPELAKRFIDFTLSEHGQALWQFHATGVAPTSEDVMGPRVHELRRMPVRRVMYEKYFDRFVDRVNPFELASSAAPQGWRSMISPLFGAFAVDSHNELKRAWRAMRRAQERGADEELLAEMDRILFSFPLHVLADGRELEMTPENYADIRADWRDPLRTDELKILYTRFFRGQYRKVVELARGVG